MHRPSPPRRRPTDAPSTAGQFTMFNSRETSSFRTFEIGHPAFAAAAASSIFALSAPGAVTFVVSALYVSVRFTKVMSQVVSIDFGVMPRSPS